MQNLGRERLSLKTAFINNNEIGPIGSGDDSRLSAHDRDRMSHRYPRLSRRASLYIYRGIGRSFFRGCATRFNVTRARYVSSLSIAAKWQRDFSRCKCRIIAILLTHFHAALLSPKRHAWRTTFAAVSDSDKFRALQESSTTRWSCEFSLFLFRFRYAIYLKSWGVEKHWEKKLFLTVIV